MPSILALACDAVVGLRSSLRGMAYGAERSRGIRPEADDKLVALRDDPTVISPATHSRTARARRAVGVAILALLGVTAFAGCGQDDTPAATSTPPDPVSAAQSPFDSLQQQFVRVIHTVSPQVVQIQGSRGLGSGVVFDDHGNIVTNAHVVAAERRFVVTLAGGERPPATLVGADTSHDLAVVHVAGATPA